MRDADHSLNEEGLSEALARGYLLAGLRGKVPAAPAWFRASLAVPPERTFIDVGGVDIETLSWGPQGSPGLILLHGQGACADWWSFIAPFFATTFRVTAFSLSGMGRSGRRDQYEMSVYAEEMFAVARECGHYAAPCAPIAIAHSFGGLPLLVAGATKGSQLKAAVLIDSYISASKTTNADIPARDPDKIRSFASLAEALARFRLLPQQECANLYLVDYIARHSLCEEEPSSGRASGWRWRVDPDVRRKTVRIDAAAYLARAGCPIALMRGSRSQLCTADHQLDALRIAPNGTPFIAVPDADHHVMLDQPLALVAALEGLLAGWPGA
jgi:pimeloyl-ACP methyl ester carboxylesterase